MDSLYLDKPNTVIAHTGAFDIHPVIKLQGSSNEYPSTPFLYFYNKEEQLTHDCIASVSSRTFNKIIKEIIANGGDIAEKVKTLMIRAEDLGYSRLCSNANFTIVLERQEKSKVDSWSEEDKKISVCNHTLYVSRLLDWNMEHHMVEIPSDLSGMRNIDGVNVTDKNGVKFQMNSVMTSFRDKITWGTDGNSYRGDNQVNIGDAILEESKLGPKKHFNFSFNKNETNCDMLLTFSRNRDTDDQDFTLFILYNHIGSDSGEDRAIDFASTLSRTLSFVLASLKGREFDRSIMMGGSTSIKPQQTGSSLSLNFNEVKYI